MKKKSLQRNDAYFIDTSVKFELTAATFKIGVTSPYSIGDEHEIICARRGVACRRVTNLTGAALCRHPNEIISQRDGGRELL